MSLPALMFAHGGVPGVELRRMVRCLFQTSQSALVCADDLCDHGGHVAPRTSIVRVMDDGSSSQWVEQVAIHA